MKRIQLITAALCLVMLITVGAGVVTAKQTENPRQAGSSHIYFFDVKATDTHGTGKLMINLAEHKFVFNGKEFDPTRTYYLRYTVAGIAGVHTFASVTATRSGTLHVEGTWTTDLSSLPAAPAFAASTNPVVAILSATSGVPQPGGTSYYLTAFLSTSSAGPIVRYALYEDIYTNGQLSGTTLYDGPNPLLYKIGYGYPFFVATSGFSKIVTTLVVYDSVGNSNTTKLDWYPSS